MDEVASSVSLDELIVSSVGETRPDGPGEVVDIEQRVNDAIPD